jgi:hypothetical protein
VFDGRFVYLVPFVSSHLVRYDTLAAFADAASWSSFDTMNLYVASQYGVVLRFDAKSPPSSPAMAHGSFF